MAVRNLSLKRIQMKFSNQDGMSNCFSVYLRNVLLHYTYRVLSECLQPLDTEMTKPFEQGYLSVL